MNNDFIKEREFVLDLAKKGIEGNIKLSRQQKKYIKNLLLFALMNASANSSVTNKNFLKLVNKLFKGFLVKIIKESLDDDDDDIEEALDVELNKIIASESLLKMTDLQDIFAPKKIFSFLKNNTTGLSQKDLINRLTALRDAKTNYRETPEEREKRKNNQREFELSKARQRIMARDVKTR